jgi:hypothetical protein
VGSISTWQMFFFGGDNLKLQILEKKWMPFCFGCRKMRRLFAAPLVDNAFAMSTKKREVGLFYEEF